jgi:hypothetical protein
MEAARTRVGRVTMKNGGADVRVLHRAPQGEVISRAQTLISDAMQYDDRPTAFVGIFFWRDDREPWRPTYSLGWDTRDPNLPFPRLMRVAAAEIAEFSATAKAEDRVMRALGYRRTDDEPDGAA